MSAEREVFVFPVSFAQRRLWLVEQVAGGRATYNMVSVLVVAGALAPARLRRAFAGVVERHESLRTTFGTSDGEPVQMIRPAGSGEEGVALPVIDLERLPAGRRRGEVERLAHDEEARRFDLVRGPLVRLRLCRLAQDDHRLLLALHHIVSDGWSMGVLVRELTALYDAFGRGAPSPLPELPIQYADFTAWQLERLDEAALAPHLEFWRERLEGAPPVLDLPVDRPRPPVAGPRGGSRPVTLPPELAGEIDALARREGGTRLTVLFALFDLLLWCHTGQDDLVVGWPTSGRDRTELEPLIGFFVNTLVLRTRLDPGSGFRELHRQVRDEAFAALGHQELPFDRLVEALQPEREASHTPLFQVMLVLQHGADRAAARSGPFPDSDVGGGPDFRPETPAPTTARFDLTLNLEPSGAGLGGQLEYRSELFDAATIDRLAGHFKRLAAAAFGRPEAPLRDLDLFAPAERQAVLVEWSAGPGSTSEPGSEREPEPYLRRLARRLAESPDATALDGPGEALSYGELARRVRRLAASLVRAGVGSEEVVGLLLERSTAAVVGMLAILEAGGAYLPLDPTYPAERLAYMMADSGVRVVVTRRGLARAPGGAPLGAPPARTVLVEDVLEASSEEAGGQSRTVAPEALAYVIYTSGSTGRPKGVAVSRRSLAAMAGALTARYGIDAPSRLLQMAPLSFDASAAEVFPTLAAGGTLCLAEADDLLPGPGLLRLLAERAVTHLTLVPSALAALSAAADPEEAPAALSTLVVAGEAFPAELASRWSRGWARGRAGRRLIDAYGPTEASVCAAAGDLESCRPAAGPPPIGRPVGAARLVPVDRYLRPAPPGVAGELVIGGPGVARGYRGRPAATAERFVPDPFAASGTPPGARLYRTGDRVRSLADGRLDFLGRIDRQVKVRGFRVEPAEVEAALAAHPAVAEVAVVVREVGGVAALAAFLVPAAGAALPPVEGADGLGAFCRRRLPEHLVPTSWSVVDGLPLTPAGKVDRAALRELSAGAGAPSGPGTSGAAPFRWPRGPVEELLAGIWEEVLGLGDGARGGRVGADDHFFELGGHSLLAVRVAARVRRALGVELPVRTLFEAPVLSLLAGRLEELVRRAGEGGGDDAEPPAPPLEPVPREARPGEPAEAPLSFAQQRLWLLDRLEPGSPAYNIPVAFELEGLFERNGLRALARALAALVARHEVLRTSFAERGGEPVQRIAPPPPPRLPVVDLAALAGPRARVEARRLGRAEARRPFDLARGPLVRWTALRLPAGPCRLLVTQHHAISDGWSMGILARELEALYRAARAGRPAGLAPLPVQYADFAVWQRRRLSGPLLERRLAFWTTRLAGVPQSLDLPTDRPRPPVQGPRGKGHRVGLAVDLAAALETLARREAATPFMVLLAAFGAVLGRWSGQDELLVGTPVAGRDRPEVEGLIGFFVNTLALRVDLHGPGGFRQLLARVRDEALEAYAHDDLPFERLVEALAPERDRSRNPLVQVLFTFQSGPVPGTPGQRAPGGGDGSSAEPFVAHEVASDTAKMDLTLALERTPEGYTGSLVRSVELFDGTTVRRLFGHLAHLLAAALADPEQPVATLPLLGAAERWQITGEWNDTEPVRSPAAGLYELFAERADRAPDAVALVAGAEHLSYRELGARAGRLAGHLAALGVGPGVLAAVCLERRPALVVALLAVLGAGGAYLPLDSAYPQERLGFLLADADAALVVTEEGAAGALPAGGPRRLLLTAGGTALEPAPTGPSVALRPARPGDLAYLIYTSGSTGRPKAVAIEHRSASALVRWAEEVFPPEDLAGVLASTSVTFDLSVFELFVTLALGGTVILADDALHLPRLPAAGRVRLLNTVPSAAAELVRRGALPPSVRTVNLAGEPLPGDLAREIHRQAGPVRLFDLYGPSEDTTYSTGAAVLPGDPREPAIGRPVRGSRGYLLDRELRPVPLGVPGDLALAGRGLARGYLGRPAATAERFLPDPFAQCSAAGARPGGRIYRTGDLCRQRGDGTLEYLGRLDHQVKLRGFRIELGEIEAVLREQPGVREAVVVARGASVADRRLEAFVALERRPHAPEDEARELEALRRGVAAKLAPYMVPAAFEILAALPRTPHGKVDRKALPEIGPAGGASGGSGGPGGSDGSGRVGEGPADAPRTPVQEVLAGIWGEVLAEAGRGGPVGLHDDFFRSGGHSLLAARVIARVRDAFEVELPLASLFDAPTVAGLAARIEAAAGLDSAPPRPPVTPVPRPGPVPLSLAQQRLWFLDRYEPGSPIYNLPAAWAVSGRPGSADLEAAALAAALGELVRRHEALRTTFSEATGEGGATEPVQVVSPPGPVALPVVDLSALAVAARTAEAARLADREACRPFDLVAGPLFRAALVRLSGGEHHLLATLHHIVSDGASMEVLARELGALYGAFAEGLPSPLPELPCQYGDFTLWERRFLSGDVLEEQLGYWRRKLDGLEGALDLPADRPRPPVQTSRGAHRAVALSPGLARRLEALGQLSGTTSFMVLAAAAAALLGRLADRDDLALGTPVAHRGRPELEGLIGFFVNTLVLRFDLAGDPGFRELLARVRTTALEAYAHQDLPFERLVEALHPVRDLSRTPFFSVMFLAGTERRPPALGPGLALRELPVDNRTAKYDLTLHLALHPAAGDEGATAGAEYNADLFDATTVERLLRQLGTLLEGAAEAPETPLSELPLLAPAERHQLVAEWSRPAARRPPELGLGELFEARAARTPDAVVVAAGVGGGARAESLTYRGLDERADALALRLAALGVAPDAAVAVALDRSVELVVALVAVAKAGGAYVPLDLEYPAERLAGMLEDAAVEVLVTRRDALERLPAGLRPARVLCLDDPAPVAPRGAALRLRRPAGPGHLAYVMFTSGSTGRPKGVAVPQRAVVRLVRETGFARLGPEETFLLLAPVSFDASTLELWAPLLGGGRLVVAPPGPLSVEALGRTVAAGGVTLLWLTAGLFHQVAEADGPEGLDAFRGVGQLLAGGDVLSPGSCRRVLEALPGLTLIDGYGPTENTTFTCCHPMASPADVGEPVPIGRPIAHTAVQVVDRGGRPVPTGVAGELVAGGAGLARGYSGRPAATAERFVPDPFTGGGGEAPGGRLYRTGDRVRRRPDGRIEFLGRLDRQVKVRGFRIEPAEIESVLADHPGLAGAAVVARRDGAGGPRLVAYVVVATPSAASAAPAPGKPSSGGGAPDARELRGYLGERLPEYMVPSAFVTLPALPLAATGKVDRRALAESPELAPQGPADGAGEARRRVAPRSPVEEALLAIWSEVLGIEPAALGVHDDFFDLGGHSLLATRVVSRVRAVLGVEVPLRRLFEEPTVAALAAHVEAGRGGARGAAGAVTDAPAPVPRSGDLPLSFGQQRFWFLDRLDPGNPGFNVPLPARLVGPLEPAALAAALGDLTARHEALRTVFPSREGAPRQLIRPPAAVPLPVVDLTGLAGSAGSAGLAPERAEAEALRLAAADGHRPFDLARGPLLRAALVRLPAGGDGGRHLLLLAMHHIVCDGASVDLLLDDLDALYRARRGRRQGRPAHPAALPDLPLQYADYAVWQRRHLTGKALERDVEFWRGRLGGELPVLDLPTDRPRPPGHGSRSRRGALLARTLPTALARAVRELSRSLAATPYMVFLAAFDALLLRYTGATDLLVGSPVANRDRPELEGLVGFFVNTLVLRLDLAGDPTFEELVARAREEALGAYAHAALPFERLVEELQPRRAASGVPLFQVMMALHGASASRGSGSGSRRGRSLGAARLEPLEVHNGTAQFDLTLYVVDEGDGFTALAEIDRDLFEPATGARLLEHLETLLSEAAEEPGRRLSALAPEVRGMVRRPARAPARPAETRPEPAAAALPAAAARPPEAPADARRARLAERLAERKAHLTPEQRAALERRLGGGSRPDRAARAAEAPPERPSLVPLQEAGTLPPLFLVHPAGGDVLCFQLLAHYLTRNLSGDLSGNLTGDGGEAPRSPSSGKLERPVWGLQSRGLVAGVAADTSIEAMAAHYVDEIEALRAAHGAPGDPPVHLAGWSLGGVVALEMARELRRRGRATGLLAILDTTPRIGELVPAGLEDDDARWLMHMVEYAEGLSGRRLGLGYEDLAALAAAGTAAQLDRVAAALGSAGLLPVGAGRGYLGRLLAVFKSNCRAVARYEPGPSPGAITLFRAADSPEADPEVDLEVGPAAALAADPTFGWGALSAEPVTVETVPGTHITLLAEPHVQELARRLARLLPPGPGEREEATEGLAAAVAEE